MTDREHDQQVHASFESEHDDDAFWHVTRFVIHEGFNEPYAVDLDVRSMDFSGNLSCLLGARAHASIERGDLRRTLHGILDRVESGPLIPGLVTARLRLSPALVALEHRRNSRVFTDMSVVEVLRDVLEPTLAAFGRKLDTGWLGESYPQRAYITQYQESDFDFVSRLMEDDGIAYRFTQDGDAETLVLLDDDAGYTKLATANGPEGMLPMVTADGGSDQREDLRSFTRNVKLTANRARAASYDWRSPSDEPSIGGDGDGLGLNADGPELEHYDFEPAPAGAGAEAIARKLDLKRRRLNQEAQKFVARTTATGITVGSTFELVDHPDNDLNGEYLVTAVRHRMSMDDAAFVSAPMAATPGSEACVYDNECDCVPLEVGFVPPKTKKRPFVPGIISATVSDAYADPDGMLAVTFHWDRKKKSTCRLQVVQPWAGDHWGTQFFPRAGMQVMVSFVNGDPDHPVILGATYNRKHATPFDDPKCSGIKTCASEDGERYNELLFDDNEGAELIRVRAQKDLDVETLEAHNLAVGTDQTTYVEGVQKDIVDGDRVAEYNANQRVTVGGERRLTVKGDEVRTVEGATYETFHRLLMRTAHGDLSDTVNGNATHTVAKSKMTIVGGNIHTSCVGDRSDETAGTHSLLASKVDITAPGGMKVLAPGGLTTIGPTKSSEIVNSSMATIQSRMASYNIRTSIARLAMSSAQTYISHRSLALEVAALKISNSPLVLDKIGSRLCSGDMQLTRAGVEVNLSPLWIKT